MFSPRVLTTSAQCPFGETSAKVCKSLLTGYLRFLLTTTPPNLYEIGGDDGDVVLKVYRWHPGRNPLASWARSGRQPGRIRLATWAQSGRKLHNDYAESAPVRPLPKMANLAPRLFTVRNTQRRKAETIRRKETPPSERVW
jgi:hypothetical protein